MYRNLFYGSLRKNEYNYNRFVEIFGEKEFQYKGTKTIKGFELYSLGSYPVIIPNPNSDIVVDEFELSKEADDAVRGMEIGAGYYETVVDGCTIYYMDEVPYYNRGKVESGDWSKYLAYGAYTVEQSI